jgi:hypothetical protein
VMYTDKTNLKADREVVGGGNELQSLPLTWAFELVSLGFTWFDLASHASSWFDLVLLGFTLLQPQTQMCIYIYIYISMKNNGRFYFSAMYKKGFF